MQDDQNYFCLDENILEGYDNVGKQLKSRNNPIIGAQWILLR